MSDNTPRLGLPELAQMQEMDSAQINEALVQLDALGCVSLKGLFVNDPPASPADGDTYVTGGAPTGAWAGYAYKIAYCIDGGWRVFTPFDGLVAHRADTDSFVVYRGGQWTALGALMAGPEVNIASAATCDLGAAGALCVQITGTTAIASFGTGANLLRLVRFADTLTLTHNPTSLVLPGGADIATAAGDAAGFRSDSAGNWRCLFYSRADGRMIDMADPTFSGRLTVNGGATADPLSINSTDASGAYARLQNSGTTFGIVGAAKNALSGSLSASSLALNANVGSLYLNTSGILAFYKSASEMARFGTDGSFLVGTTTNGGWSGGAKAALQSSSDTLSLYNSGTGSTCLLFRLDSNSSSFANFQTFASGSQAVVGGITTNGTSTTYATTSDARLKHILAEQGDYRAAIKALWVGDFEWKTSGQKAFGVVAQQAWEHMPHRMGVTRPGNEEEFWSASAEPFGHLALWGVKDLYALVDDMAARIAALEERIAVLEARP